VKILVTAKRVTDPDATIRLKADKTGIELDGVEYKPNPFCENAIEEALRLKEENGGEVVVVSIGPTEVTSTIRTALAMGGDRGILVTGITDEELDSDLCARILQKLAEKESPDLFLLGKQAIDGDSNQVGQLLSEYLGQPQACFASEVKMSGDRLEVTREVDGGLETVSVSLPAVVTADLRLNEPRYASLPGIMKAKKKTIDEIPVGELGVDTALKVVTLRFDNPPEREGGCQMVESVDDLVAKLQSEAKVI
jgi:electron transfer flavoprotein beta subunit